MAQRGQKRRAEETEEQRNSRLSDMAQRSQERRAKEIRRTKEWSIVTWKEIQQELFVGQKPQDRHDFLARVSHQKRKTLMKLITKAKIFGEFKCHMYKIERQKRGISHAHILICHKDSLHIQRVDDFISEEIYNPQEDPDLFCIVKNRLCTAHAEDSIHV
ncbi:hypothetical protein AVEN_183873-1 [Araneus ventricosus]|uniref:Helitron helicase-like domain-containing protein n=1 Tax=Araneus ventricosus TaxID=182803 RepID=A0A4Y2FN55_ARAVE|nr:hypothetical protein AVEN_183873-1 [Araneus ventricosus]